MKAMKFFPRFHTGSENDRRLHTQIERKMKTTFLNGEDVERREKTCIQADIESNHIWGFLIRLRIH